MKTSHIAYFSSPTDAPILYHLEKDGATAVVNEPTKVTVDILISAQLLTLLHLNAPKNSQQYTQQLLPHMVESHLAEPLERLHILRVKLSAGDKRLIVAVMPRALWTHIQQISEQSQWKIGNCWIDALCLPTHATSAIYFELSETEILWRSPNGQIFSGQQSLLTQTEDYQTYPCEAVTTKQSSIEQLLQWTQTTSHEVYDENAPTKINHLKVATLLLSALTLVLWTGKLVIENNRTAQLADAYYDASLDIFHQVLPQYKKIPTRSYLTQQLERALERDIESTDENWQQWLTQLDEAVTNHEVEVMSITYEAQPARMVLTLKTNQAREIDALQQQLSTSVMVNVVDELQGKPIFRTLEVTP